MHVTEGVTFTVLLSTAGVMGCPADAGFLCNKAAMLRATEKETFCISAFGVLLVHTHTRRS
jgi:energy-converting hydrogenase Eha subunit H